jgi:hypothetical protein
MDSSGTKTSFKGRISLLTSLNELFDRRETEDDCPAAGAFDI